MLKIIPYDRFAGVAYAHRWAYERNPKYMNFDELEGIVLTLLPSASMPGLES